MSSNQNIAEFTDWADRELSEKEKEEAKSLRRLATQVSVYLSILSLAAFFAGSVLIETQRSDLLTLAIALLGLAGSGVAALTSCLNRRALGVELESGRKLPPEPEEKQESTKERFNLALRDWFIFRPFLGLIVAPIFVWGIELLVKNAAAFTGSPRRLAFTAFMGGLLAKSVIELIKGLFKSVFKT
jgi:hypothetical protein